MLYNLSGEESECCLCIDTVGIIFSQNEKYKIIKNTTKGRPAENKMFKDKIARIFTYYISPKIVTSLGEIAWKIFFAMTDDFSIYSFEAGKDAKMQEEKDQGLD